MYSRQVSSDDQDQILAGSEPRVVTKQPETTTKESNKNALKITRNFPRNSVEQSRNTIEFYHMPEDRVFGFLMDSPTKFSYEAKTNEENNIRMKLIQDFNEPNVQVFVENFASAEDTETEEETEVDLITTTMTAL